VPETEALIFLTLDRTLKKLPPGEGKNRVEERELPLAVQDVL
jgi:hypothetical protein